MTNKKTVIVPRQGQSVESCVIGQWLKKVGDQLAVDDGTVLPHASLSHVGRVLRRATDRGLHKVFGRPRITAYLVIRTNAGIFKEVQATVVTLDAFDKNGWQKLYTL